MDLNIGKEVAALKRMTVKELQSRYAEVYGDETRTGNRAWLMKRIIWRLQALAEGDLSERARRRATELANDADLRRNAPKSPPAAPDAGTRTRTGRMPTKDDRRLPLPGSMITRLYKGETLEVKVLPAGFEYEGETYKSLSAVAKKVTGQHCNGYLFFRLTEQGGGR